MMQMKKTVWKDIRQSFRKSWGRFFSIMILMALGSFALVGLYVTGPNMRTTGTTYLNARNVADLTIIGEYGLDASDQAALATLTDVNALEYLYVKDVSIAQTHTSVRLFSQPKTISTPELIAGRLPRQSGEIAIDASQQADYPLGSIIHIDEKADQSGTKVIAKSEFEVVGYIQSGDFLSLATRGPSTTGTGQLDSFAIIHPSDFKSDVFMMAKLRFDSLIELNPYSDAYLEQLQIEKDHVYAVLAGQPEIRLHELKTTYNQKITTGQQAINEGEQELDNAAKQLEEAATLLKEGQQALVANEQLLLSAEAELEQAKQELRENEVLLQNTDTELQRTDEILREQQALLAGKQQEYEQGVQTLQGKQAEYNQAVADIDQAQQTITEQYKQLATAKQDYTRGISELEATIFALEQALGDEALDDAARQQLLAQLEQVNQQLKAVTSAYTLFLQQTYEPGVIQLDAAQKQLDQQTQQLQTVPYEIEAANNQLAEANLQIASGQAQLLAGKAAFADGYAHYESGVQQITTAKQQLITATTEYQMGKEQLADGQSELIEQTSLYEEQRKKYEQELPTATKLLAESREELATAREMVEQLVAPTYRVDTRRELLGGDGYKTYSSISNIVDSLAMIFPVFLYFVAALVTLTTMTRFVDEERLNSGTLKALGYDDYDIIKKFCVYGFVASLIGTILGIILGHTLMPTIVYQAYRSEFTVPAIEWHFHLGITLSALALAIMSSVIPAYIVAKRELREQPATLLLPKAPESGDKIFLEHFPGIWRRLTFTQKVTCRNIFRYKKRMYMTIFGVAGAAALLFTGFSVQHSVSEIKSRQFDTITHYDLIVAENPLASMPEQQQLSEQLRTPAVKNYAPVYYEEVTRVAGAHNDTQAITLIVPEEPENFAQYITLKARKTQQPLELMDEGAIISERLADLLHVEIGETLPFVDQNGEQRQVEITAISEMYIGHFIFLSPSGYEKLYRADYESNAYFTTLIDSSSENTKVAASQFMQLSAVAGVVQNTSIMSLIDTIVTSLNQIMAILIFVAMLLGAVILYNLTNINVSERIRELSTIKVLGFFDPEVTRYIYREATILTIFGIVGGWIIGMGLHSYILVVVPPDEVMFNPARWIGAYIIPVLVIAIISLVLKFFVNRRLIHIDMLEALKSVD